MVHLIGVTSGHNGHGLYPTEELYQALQQQPKRTRVGLGTVSPSDWRRICEHNDNLPFKPVGRDRETQRPSYARDSQAYWDCMYPQCWSMDFPVTYLDDVDCWMRLNEAAIAMAEGYTHHRRDRVHNEVVICRVSLSST